MFLTINKIKELKIYFECITMNVILIITKEEE